MKSKKTIKIMIKEVNRALDHVDRLEKLYLQSKKKKKVLK